jgi:hypothetical protein
MKTRDIGFWTIAALAAGLLVAPAAYSETERFSARLVGTLDRLSNYVTRHRRSKCETILGKLQGLAMP